MQSDTCCSLLSPNIYTQRVFLSVFIFCQMDGDSTAALSSTGKEGADDNVQYAGPHSLDPVHVDEKQLHTGHDQPGERHRDKVDKT